MPILLFALVSCNNYEKEVNTLDELSLKLDTAEVNMLAIDSIKINNKAERVKENMKILETKYKDKLKKSQSFLVDRYRRISKSVRRFNRAYVNTKAEIKNSKSQISNLKEDLDNKAIKDKKKIDEYLADEVKAVTEVYEYTFEVNDWYGRTIKVFDELNPKVTFLIDSLETH